MNFQSLQKIEKSEVYIKTAFNSARIKTLKLSIRKSRSRQEKLIILSKEKIKRFGININKQLSNIVENFPRIDELPDFYRELCRITLDPDKLKKSLYSISWATKKIDELTKKYPRIIEKTGKTEKEKEYYGRVTSILKNLDENLIFIDECRKIMKGFPAIKTDLFTVAIAGFPNVGKSTLLSKITSAKPEIKNYSFTTKNLNLGYAIFGIKKIQFIDTPGTLNRFEKMNNIEKQAYLVMKTLADAIIYVFDPLEQFPMHDQEILLRKIQEYGKPVIIYISKTDIIPIKKKGAYTDPKEILTEIISLSKNK